MIRWETLITDHEHPGRISLHRVRKLVEIVAFCLAVGVALVATLLEVLTRVEVPTDMILILVGALIVPITGGQVSDAIFGSRLAQRIATGHVPGRRQTDVTTVPPAERGDEGGSA